jgi:hypothetical protein
MSTWRRPERGAGTFVAGSLGVGLIILGGSLFFAQLLVWFQRQVWQSMTMASLLADVWTRTIAPRIPSWFGDVRGDLDEAVLYVLNALPLSLCLIVVGATIVYYATRARR